MATIEIDAAYVSQNVTVTNGENINDSIFSLADQRISQIEQKVTALGSLADIISKFNLYPSLRKTTPIAEIADAMRNKIKLNFISSAVSNPAAAQKESAEQLSAIAFTVSFDYSDPQIAQQVTNELVTRFLDEDLKQRRTETQDTSEFLAAEIKDLETTMADQEKKIAEFRAAHGESGPAMLMFDQQGVASAAFSLENLDSQIATNEGTQGTLRSQLAMTDPYSRVIADGQVITTPAVQLKALEAEYATLSSQYGPEYPDVVKTRKEIEALKAQIGVSQSGDDKTAQLKAQIIDAKTNLAAAESTYGPNNPDVITLKANVKKLEDQLAALPPGAPDDFIKKDADNPAYLELAVQFKAAEEQHKTLVAERDALVKQRDKYQHEIMENPGLERQMAALSRDYENSQLRYRELKEKKMAADMSEKLEEERKGQRLIVINPPKIPRTTQPSRLLLMLGGVIFSIIGGLGSVAVSEAMNQSIYGQSHLEALMGTAPLVSVPHLRTAVEIDYALARRPYIISAIVCASVLALIIVVLV